MITITRTVFGNVKQMEKYFERIIGKKFVDAVPVPTSHPALTPVEVKRVVENVVITLDEYDFASRLVDAIKSGSLFYSESQASRRIQAIKTFRVHSPELGLKEAKDVIDFFWNK